MTQQKDQAVVTIHVGTYLWRSARVVQTQLLDAEEVFAVRDALWDVGRVGVCRVFGVSAYAFS